MTNIKNIFFSIGDWIEARWRSLQERFHAALKLSGTKQQPKFKYFNEMLFLAPEGRTHQNRKKLISNEPEFIITKKELEDYSDDGDSENVFEEIITESEEPQTVDQTTHTVITEIFGDECDSTEPENENNPQHTQKRRSSQLYQGDIEEETVDVEQPPVKMSKLESSATIKIKEENEAEAITTSAKDCEDFKEDSKPIEMLAPNSVEKSSDRCEDTIFGELVTVMLKGIPDAKKKQAKKEIMNILLS